MNIVTFHDYYHYVAHCPLITKKIKLHLDGTSGLIYYRFSDTQPHTVTPMVRNPTEPVSAKTDADYLTLPALNNDSEHTDNSPSASETSQLQPDPILSQDKTLPANIPKDDNGFSLLHSVVFHEIEHWSRQPESRNHFFYPAWIEAKYKNLHPTSSWNETSRILKLNNYEDYIVFTQQCPHIGDT